MTLYYSFQKGHVYFKVISISNWSADAVEKHLAFGEFWDGGLLDGGTTTTTTTTTTTAAASDVDVPTTSSGADASTNLGDRLRRTAGLSTDRYVKTSYCYGHAGE